MNLASLLATAQIPPQYNPPNPTAQGQGTPAPAPAPAPRGLTPTYGPVIPNKDPQDFKLRNIGKGTLSALIPEAIDQIYSKLFGWNDKDESFEHIKRLKKEGKIGKEPWQVSEDEANEFFASGGFDGRKSFMDEAMNPLLSTAASGIRGGGAGPLSAIGGGLLIPPIEQFGRSRHTSNLADQLGNYANARKNRHSIMENWSKYSPETRDMIKSTIGEEIPLSEYYPTNEKLNIPLSQRIRNGQQKPMSDEKRQELTYPTGDTL